MNPEMYKVVINEDKRIFLVNDKGVITCMGHVSETQEHVSTIMEDYVNNDNQLLLSHHNDVDVCMLRSALCEAHCQNESLTNTVTQLHADVAAAKEAICRLEDELWREKASQEILTSTVRAVGCPERGRNRKC